MSRSYSAMAFVSFLFLVLISAAPRAHAQTTKATKDALVGHWQLVSIAVNDATPYGENPRGSMFFDAGGNYSIIVLSDGLAKNIFYFGTYTVNDADNSISLHIDGASRANADGRDLKRLVTFSADQLVI